MKNLLVIAKRETGRFRSRFTVASLAFILVALLVAVAVALLAGEHGATFNDDIYRVGASADAPEVDDARIALSTMGYADGIARLKSGEIDAYLDGSTVVYRRDDQSAYTVEALNQYFERADLDRIARSYALNDSFPLRVQVEELDLLQENVTSGGFASLTTATDATPAPSPGLTPTAPAETISSGDGTASGSTGAGTNPAMPSPATSPFTSGESGNSGTPGTLPASPGSFLRSGDILIPSLMEPPLPLAQVLMSFMYVMPIFFIGIFFVGSFMDEKTSKRLNVLMSAPVTPYEVICGKLLPYVALSLAITLGISLLTGGDPLLALLIMFPVTLFIFAIFLMVAIFYRTYRDQTFFSMAAIAFVTAYLVFPALFTGVSEVSYISPLTLIAQMYKGQVLGLKEYAFSIVPMGAVFGVTLVLAARTFNEEFLISYGPMYRKVGEAVFLAVDLRHPLLSAGAIGFCSVAPVFMLQLAIIALSSNLPGLWALGASVLCCVLAEEVAKSACVAGLISNDRAGSLLNVILLSLASAIGFFIAEKALLFISLGFVSQSLLMSAVAGSGLLIMPLLAHFCFTAIVCMSTYLLGIRWYGLAVVAGGLLHFGYNMVIMGVLV